MAIRVIQATLLSAACAAIALSATGAARAGADAPVARVPIHAAIAAPSGEAVVPRAFLETMVARADQIFAPASLAFDLADVRTVDGAYARLETRTDRHALAAEIRPGVVNVFVVASLRDVDDPRLVRQGVHWRPPRVASSVHYVIVSAIAGPDVLAHELGHYFGNHRHSDMPGNIMSYTRAEAPFFDPAQLRVIGRHVERFVRSRELVLSRR